MVLDAHHIMVLVHNYVQARSATAVADKRLQGWALEGGMDVKQTLDWMLLRKTIQLQPTVSWKISFVVVFQLM